MAIPVPLKPGETLERLPRVAAKRAKTKVSPLGDKRVPVTSPAPSKEGKLSPSKEVLSYCSQPDPAANQAATPCDGPSGPLPPCLRITALHALDRVSIEPGGPRHIESIDTLAMLPRFTNRS
jgi:hypothetical protein